MITIAAPLVWDSLVLKVIGCSDVGQHLHSCGLPWLKLLGIVDWVCLLRHPLGYMIIHPYIYLR